MRRTRHALQAAAASGASGGGWGREIGIVAQRLAAAVHVVRPDVAAHTAVDDYRPLLSRLAAQDASAFQFVLGLPSYQEGTNYLAVMTYLDLVPPGIVLQTRADTNSIIATAASDDTIGLAASALQSAASDLGQSPPSHDALMAVLAALPDVVVDAFAYTSGQGAAKLAMARYLRLIA